MTATAHKARVLVIDDDAAVRDSLQALLEIKNFEVVAFESCDSFLNTAAGVPGDCLVLDLHMAGTNGLDLLRTLKQRGTPLPTIVLTGRGSTEARSAALDLGALTMLDKPVRPADLFAALDLALSARAT